MQFTGHFYLKITIETIISLKMKLRLLKIISYNSYSNKKASHFCEAFCGPDGTRTRDLRRDRAAF